MVICRWIISAVALLDLEFKDPKEQRSTCISRGMRQFADAGTPMREKRVHFPRCSPIGGKC